MHVAQTIYRELHGSLLAYEGGSLYADVLAPWLEANAGERSWLRSFACRRGSSVPAAEPEDLWRLYDDGLTREERVELLTHRCFITTAKQHDDRYPYEDRLRSEA
ncbi:hypothetical protein BE17_08590 [Sorangium cellulosum]|uniref:Uncharacterized protein n=1 Tax=Sorangium cellulosum TaxID=56 RepID=A0A150RDS5_SORCE|nr:hypothetical protein BE17_08590 [Sorangium cellulosum]